MSAAVYRRSAPARYLRLRRSGRPVRLPSLAPHRSGRAGLPHPALQVEVSLLTVDGMNDYGLRERVSLQQTRKPIKTHPGALRTTRQPLLPVHQYPSPELFEQSAISGNPEVAVVPFQFRNEWRYPVSCVTGFG